MKKNLIMTVTDNNDSGDSIMMIKNNGNKDKTVTNEDGLDEALQQQEYSSTNSPASFKKKKTSMKPEILAILVIQW